MKLLLLISHGLYLRNYGGLVENLARAGHEVILAKTAAKEVDDSALHRFASEEPGVRRLTPPDRSSWWWAVNDPLRAARDYLRYLEPAYRDAPRLAERAARRIPRPIRLAFEGSGLARLGPIRCGVDWLLATIEKATPPDPAATLWLAGLRPDAVLITPLIDFDYVQLDLLKAAVAIGAPTALLVASWDNLTNKGSIQIMPDMVTVWNEDQRREAETMHGVPPARIIVTGAQLFDHWFTMRPRMSREEYCARVGGIDPRRPIILYLCSSSFICPDEVQIVRRWLAAVRACDDPMVRSANVVVRPHPANDAQWQGVELSDEEGVSSIWPSSGASPIDAPRQHDYYDSLNHAAAIIGVNTSGFLEAAIIGRRSLVLSTPETAEMQEGTLHFRYLLKDGFVLYALDLGTHLEQLGKALRGADQDAAVLRQFAADFLRPHGLDRPALPYLVEAVVELARQPYQTPTRVPWWGLPVRALLAPIGIAVRRGYIARLARRGVPPASAAAAPTPPAAGLNSRRPSS